MPIIVFCWIKFFSHTIMSRIVITTHLLYRENRPTDNASRQGQGGRQCQTSNTKNPVCSFNCPCCQVRGITFERFLFPCRQLARYRAPSFVLTNLWGARGTQRAIDSGFVLIGRRGTRCSLSASPRLRWAYSRWDGNFRLMFIKSPRFPTFSFCDLRD